MTLAELIAEARRLDEAATKGPWDAAKVATLDYGDRFVASVPGREGDLLCEYAISAASCSHVPVETGKHDAVFIAFARTVLPRLARVAEKTLTLFATLDHVAPNWREYTCAIDGDEVNRAWVELEKELGQGPDAAAGGEDGRGSASPASSLAANSARTPDGCPSCAVLSRQYGLVIEQNAALAARNRALETQLARLLTSEDTLRAALRDLHAAGGGE